MYTDERAIEVSDSTLSLSILNEPSLYPVGAVNTKNTVTVGPGTYMEARTRAANLPGTTSNFWSKPNSEAWPPEIDVKETPIRDENDVDRSIHHIHWTTDGQPGGPHADLNLGSSGGYDHSAEWTVYGLRWLEDSVTYYVNGQEHARTERAGVMESLNNGAPFYVMLDVMNWPGPDLHPDDFAGYKTTHEVDWIRVWEPGSGGGSTTTTTPEETETPTEEEPTPTDDTEEHYVWFRSSTDGEPVTFAFRASGGNIRLDSSGFEADMWIAEDGETAGGTTDRFLRIPGFFYEGEISDLAYEGPLQVYVDDERMDPDSLVDESTDGPTEPGSEEETDTPSDDEGHYVWFRSSTDGEPVTFAFRASGGNIRLDSSGFEADMWIAEDGETAGGTTDRFLRIPGFFYRGEISDLAYEGPLQVYVDDERMDPDSLVDESTDGPTEPGSDGSQPLSRTVTIDGRGSGGTSGYSITVSDGIETTASTEGVDAVSGSTATGRVGDGVDKYRFAGSITGLAVDGDATVSVDGSPVGLLLIERHPDSDGSVTYLVESTGRLLKADVPEATVDPSDVVGTAKAYGEVGDATDAYWVFDGDVADVSTFGGRVVTTLDGDVVDLTD